MTMKCKHPHWTKGCTDRINTLRDQYWNYKPCVDIERSEVFTRVYQETEDEDLIIRRAMAFKAYMSERKRRI